MSSSSSSIACAAADRPLAPLSAALFSLLGWLDRLENQVRRLRVELSDSSSSLVEGASLGAASADLRVGVFRMSSLGLAAAFSFWLSVWRTSTSWASRHHLRRRVYFPQPSLPLLPFCHYKSISNIARSVGALALLS